MSDIERELSGLDSIALDEVTRTGGRVAALRVIGAATGFVASILFARTLGPVGRGLYALPVATLTIAVVLGRVGLENGQVYMARRNHKLDELWGNGTYAASGIGLASAGVMIAAHAIWGTQLFGDVPMSWILLVAIQVPIVLASLFWGGVLQLAGKVAGFVASYSVGSVVQMCLAVGLVLAGELTPFRVLILMLVANLTVFIGVLFVSLRANVASLRFRSASLSAALVFGLKSHFGLVALVLLLSVDQLIVRAIEGFRALGLYALAVSLAQLIWLLTDPLAATVLSHQVRSPHRGHVRLGLAVTRMSLLLGAMVALLGAVLAPFAIPLVFGTEFRGAIAPFQLLLPGVVVLAIQRTLMGVLVMEGRAWFLSGLSVLALAVNIGLNFALIPLIGISGASIASSACYVALALGFSASILRDEGLPWSNLIPRRADLARLRLMGRRRDSTQGGA
ncbi:MAG: polysaccharide biosynthesis C-terminal domain-containing protein [Actinomycetota bacterium]